MRKDLTSSLDAVVEEVRAVTVGVESCRGCLAADERFSFEEGDSEFGGVFAKVAAQDMPAAPPPTMRTLLGGIGRTWGGEMVCQRGGRMAGEPF